MDAVNSRVVDLAGPVHYLDFGGTGPTMVLVHGLGGSALNWMAVGPALARRARVLALDLIGFGRTPPAGRPVTIPAQTDLVDRFITGVAGGQAILVGNSMGGLIAMLQAARAPAQNAALVLAAPAQPALRAGIDLEVLAAFPAYALPRLGKWVVRRRAARLGPERLVAEMFRLCCVDPTRVDPAVVAAHVALTTERAATMPWSADAFIDATRSMLAIIGRPSGFRAAAQRIAAPTLLVQGTGDRLVPLAASRALAASRPEWTLEVMDGIGHLPQLEAPDAFVAAVDRWTGRRAGAVAASTTR
jgi:pimeloyl-ACP methyl ester carboxylesterase